MATAQNNANKREKRHARIRGKVKGTAERPRLAVYKSNQYLYAQLIDDVAGKTIVSAHSRGSKKTQREQAGEVGKQIAEAGKAKKISAVVFDRGGFTYAGIIKELADSARAAGLIF